jgi:hypothetical protein
MNVSKRNILIFFGGLAVLMLVTNPSKEAFLDATLGDSEIVLRSAKYLCASGSQPIFSSLEECPPQLAQNKIVIKQFLDINTQRKNLLLVSLYSVEIPGFRLGEYQASSQNYTNLGVLGNFTGGNGVGYLAGSILIGTMAGLSILGVQVVRNLQSKKNP